MKLRTPCIDCGVPVKATRCEDCSKTSERLRLRKRTTKKQKQTTTERGYDSRWKRLSERARQAQPFCSDCGSPDDLQADHSPEAWERWEQGLPLRLADVDVVCGDCNRKRGAARPGSDRSQSKASSAHSGTGLQATADRRSQALTDPGGSPRAGQRGDSPHCPTLRMY